MTYQELLILESKGKEEVEDILSFAPIVYAHLMKFLANNYSSTSWCKSVIYGSFDLSKISSTGWITFDHNFYNNMATIKDEAFKIYKRDKNNMKIAEKCYSEVLKEYDHPCDLVNTLRLIDWMYAHVGHGTYDDKVRKYLEVAKDRVSKGESIDDL